MHHAGVGVGGRPEGYRFSCVGSRPRGPPNATPGRLAQVVVLSAAFSALALAEIEKALRHASFGYLLETGCIAGSGAAAELHDSDLLRRIYLGGTHA